MVRKITLGTDCTGIDAGYYAMRDCVATLGNDIELVYEFASEIDIKTKQLIAQTTKPQLLYGDLTQRNVHDMPKVDVYIAGFPCQTFSVIGKRQGKRDTRGRLFEYIYEYIQHKKPRCFILENVPGLISIDNGSVFTHMLDMLQDLDHYTIRYDVLSPTDIGFPQNRKRVFVQGVVKALVIGDRIKPQEYKLSEFLLPKAEAIRMQPRVIRKLTDRQQDIINQVKKLVDTNDAIYLWDTRRSRKYMYKPFPNKCPCLVQHCYSLFLLNQDRYLSCLELLLLQGLQDESLHEHLAVFHANKNLSFITKLVGNSICVPLLKYILEPILLALTAR